MIQLRKFVLTLPEDPARTERVMAHFKERGIEDVAEIWGIHAEKAGLNTSHPYLVDNPHENFLIGPKLTGVYLGHYVAWSVMNALPDSHFLLFENDVVLNPDFKERMEKALLDVPEDFDVLFLGHGCTKTRPTTHIKGEVFDVRYPLCNHAMIYAKKALPLILRTQRDCYGPVDCMLFFHSFPQLKVYTVKPSLAGQVGTVYPE